MNVSKINSQAIQYKHHQQIVEADRRHAEMLQQQRHAKEVQKDTEEKRIELNRRMNRPGQNVDRMA